MRKLIEVTSDLVVAEKEKRERAAEKFNEAIDNVLFIDEAYISTKDPNDNGRSNWWIAKIMEDYRIDNSSRCGMKLIWKNL